MRRLEKQPEPDVLVVNGADWTRDYVVAFAAGDSRRFERWRHREIKASLRSETQGKCAYCEAFLGDVSYPHVEHLVPKSVRPDLAHAWTNLTSACGPCNINKDDYYDEVDNLLNPYIDDLAQHLEFFGDYMDWNVSSRQGEITVLRLRLNRLDLVTSRVQRIHAVRSMLQRWHEADGARRRVLEDGIRLDVNQGEFTTAVRAFLRSKGFPLESASTA